MKRTKLFIFMLLTTLISTSSSADGGTVSAQGETIEEVKACDAETQKKMSVGNLMELAPKFDVEVKHGKIRINYRTASECMNNVKINYKRNEKNNIVLTFRTQGNVSNCDKSKLLSYPEIAIDIGELNLDKDKTSRVIVNSPIVAKEESGHKLSEDVYGKPDAGCGFFETPVKDKMIMANTTDAFDLYTETVKLCEQEDSRQLSDVTALHDKLQNSSGNLKFLVELVSNIQKDELVKEMEKMHEDLEELEMRIAPGDDSDDDFGLGKTELKEAIEEYADIMDKFTTEIMPSIESRLKFLEKKRKVAKDEKNEKLLKQIDKEVKELNELVAGFDREHSDNKDEFSFVVDAMAEYNLQSSGKKIFKAVKNAEFMKRVYFEDEDDLDRGDKLTLKQANARSKRAMKGAQKIFNEWKDLALVRKGKGDIVVQRRYDALKSVRTDKYKELTSLGKRFQTIMKTSYQKYCSDGITPTCQMVMDNLSKWYYRRMEVVNKKYQERYQYENTAYQGYKKLNDEYKMIEAQKEAAKARDEFSDYGSDDYSVWSNQRSSLFQFETQFDDPFMMNNQSMMGNPYMMNSPQTLPLIR